MNFSGIRLGVNQSTFIKDPESSELGLRIIRGSIDMIEEMGMESFTFRKLAKEISSTEASIYRYFESKYKLLLYLTTWYWSWMDYRLSFQLANIESAETRLDRAIRLLVEEVKEDSDFSHINEVKLNHIVIAESSKAYLTKEVDDVNSKGVFSTYKGLVGTISDIIHELQPDYKYPHMLLSTVIEGAHHQRFFAEHLPRLTDVVKGEDAIGEFYRELVFKAIGRTLPR